MTLSNKVRRLFTNLPLAIYLTIHPISTVFIPYSLSQLSCSLPVVSEQSTKSQAKEITDIIEPLTFASEIEKANKELADNVSQPNDDADDAFTINLVVLVDKEARNYLGNIWKQKIQEAVDYSNTEYGKLSTGDKKRTKIIFKVEKYSPFSSQTDDGLVMLQQLRDKFKVDPTTLVVYFTGRNITGILDDGTRTDRVVGYAYLPGSHCVIEVLYSCFNATLVHEEGHAFKAPHCENPQSFMNKFIDSVPIDEKIFDPECEKIIVDAVKNRCSDYNFSKYFKHIFAYLWDNYLVPIIAISSTTNSKLVHAPLGGPQISAIVVYQLDEILVEDTAPKIPSSRVKKFRRHDMYARQRPPKNNYLRTPYLPRPRDRI